MDVESADTLLDVYLEGNESKTLAENSLNILSSWSHTIFQISVSSYDTKYPKLVTKSVLNVVDLAGSERL